MTPPQCPHEMLFSIESKKDSAYPIIQKLLEEFPAAPARLYFSEETERTSKAFFNPKMQNLKPCFERAKYDLVLISDSNIRIQDGEIDHLISQMDEKTGVVTSVVSGEEFRGLGGFLESLFLGTFYARFMFLASAFSKPCVVGKSMLFRLSQAHRFGGVKSLASFLAEDFVTGEFMRKLGLHVRMSQIPVKQILGEYSFSSFWKRHLRWGRIRKSHAPLAFLVEPFFSPISMSLAFAWAVSDHFLTDFGAAFLGSLFFFSILDGLSYIRVSHPPFKFVLCFPGVWLLRELLGLPLWIHIAWSNEIDWRGNRFRLETGGILGKQ